MGELAQQEDCESWLTKKNSDQGSEVSRKEEPGLSWLVL